jgi:DUF4097 and DUF4098 domain-containing protein YvlB
MWFVVTAFAAPLEQSLDAPPDVSLDISLKCGKVEVVASDRGTVRISGTTTRGEKLEAVRSGDRISLAEPAGAEGDCVDLRIEAPERASLELEGVSTSLTATGLRGAIEVATISGDVTVIGEPKSVEISTISGAIAVRGGVADLELATVSGSILVEGAGGKLEGESVSGSIGVTGRAPFRDVELASVSGTIAASLALAPGGTLEAETHSGMIRLSLPADTSAALSMDTFSGAIHNAFGPKEQAVLGSGSGRIELSTFSGTIELEKR